MPNTKLQEELLDKLMGEKSILLINILQSKAVKKEVKADYLQRAITEDSQTFLRSLDELYGKYTREGKTEEKHELLKVIRELKGINDLYFNNEESVGQHLRQEIVEQIEECFFDDDEAFTIKQYLNYWLSLRVNQIIKEFTEKKPLRKIIESSHVQHKGWRTLIDSLIQEKTNSNLNTQLDHRTSSLSTAVSLSQIRANSNANHRLYPPTQIHQEVQASSAPSISASSSSNTIASTYRWGSSSSNTSPPHSSRLLSTVEIDEAESESSEWPHFWSEISTVGSINQAPSSSSSLPATNSDIALRLIELDAFNLIEQQHINTLLGSHSGLTPGDFRGLSRNQIEVILELRASGSTVAILQGTAQELRNRDWDNFSQDYRNALLYLISNLQRPVDESIQILHGMTTEGVQGLAGLRQESLSNSNISFSLGI